MRQVVIPMGGYTVVKHSAHNNIEIVSPGAQSCVVVVLKSSQGVAVAHIDNPFAVASVLNTMTNELRGQGDSVIAAELIGGDAGNPLISSSSIYRRIYNTLEKKQISYSHRNYSLDLSLILPALYTALWLANFIVPESKIIGAIALLLLAAIGNRVMSHSYDVTVDVKTGKISLVMDNEQNTLSILNKNPHLHEWLKTRMTLNPQQTENTEQLQLRRFDARVTR